MPRMARERHLVREADRPQRREIAHHAAHAPSLRLFPVRSPNKIACEACGIYLRNRPRNDWFWVRITLPRVVTF